jgi:16S rRNA (adenine1518-N6/adenine1519-N6)-dimethyltransferase
MDKGALFQDPSLDQVFMTDASIIERIVEFSELKKDETVLEIGTGPGTLTEKLARKCKKVLTIEIDERLKPDLTRKFSKTKNVEVIWGNALEVIEKGKLHYDKIVANPPYAISEALVKSLLGKEFDSAILTLPWRFVERLTANPEEDHYSKLSLFSQAFFKVETLLRIEKDAWHPRPDTLSMVIRLSPRKPGARETLVRELFLQDDKKLKNALREALVKCKGNTKRTAKDAIEDTGLPKKILDKKISGMSMEEINDIIRNVAACLS